MVGTGIKRFNETKFLPLKKVTVYLGSEVSIQLIMTLCDNYHDRDMTQNKQMPRKVAFNSNFLKEVILEMNVQTIEIGQGWSEREG